MGQKNKLDFLNKTPLIPLVFLTVMSVIMYIKMGEPILILIIPFVIAYIIWFLIGRLKPIAPSKYFLTIYIGMYVTQFFHLIEEWNTGFYNAFPALWGDFFYNHPEKFTWGITIFITGNLIMEAFWAISILLFDKKNSFANYNLYGFLAGMIINAIGHPLYCLYLGTHSNLQNYLNTNYNYNYHWYFPGFFTGLIHSIFAYLMWTEIKKQNLLTEKIASS